MKEYGGTMEVGHTKFRPDEGFGHIRQHVGSHVDALNMFELKQQINDSSTSNTNMYMPVAEMNDQKHISKAFKPFDGIKRHVACEIHIYAKQEGGRRVVYVDVSNFPFAQVSEKSVNLLRPGHQYPSLDRVHPLSRPELSKAQCESFSKDVYSVLNRNRVKLTKEEREQLLQTIDDGILPDVANCETKKQELVC